MIKLVVFDLDNVIIDGEAIDEIGKLVNVQEQIAEITKQAMNGDLDFETSIKERVKLLEGASVEDIKKLADEMDLMEGTEEAIKGLKDSGYKVAVISGSFDLIADPLKEKLDLDYLFINKLEEKDGKLTGKVSGPLVEGSKADALNIIIDENRISPDECIAVGDGANDISMMEMAQFGIAFNAKPAVKEVADIIIEKNDLKEVLAVIKDLDLNSIENSEERISEEDVEEGSKDSIEANNGSDEGSENELTIESDEELKELNSGESNDFIGSETSAEAVDLGASVVSDGSVEVADLGASVVSDGSVEVADLGASVVSDGTGDLDVSVVSDESVEAAELDASVGSDGNVEALKSKETEIPKEKDKKSSKTKGKKSKREALPEVEIDLAPTPEGVRKQKDEREELIAKIAQEREEFNKIAKEQRKIRDDLNDTLKENLKLAIELRDNRNEVNKAVEEAKKLRDGVNEELKKLEWSSGRRDKLKLENEIKKIDKIIETRVLDIKKENQLVKNANDLRKQLMDITEDEKVKDEAQKLKKISEEHHANVVELSIQAQDFHEKMLNYFRKTDDIRTEADEAHKKFIEARKSASAKHEEFKIVLSEIHIINKELGTNKSKRRRSEKHVTTKKNREEKEKAEDIFEKFKHGKKLTTEELLLLQKHDIS